MWCGAGVLIFPVTVWQLHFTALQNIPVNASANYLPVLPVLTPFSLSRGDTLSPTGSHPVIQHVYRVGV
ncbi:hypothetical protein NLN84_05790 [Citrobacter portucalensis]|uniref:hypothetical protein n=1 Tax=Citrobacter portucalensis TaxID=1639133 RepID=UPI00226B0358|nr:hypothetical protein [Citrobacter portucalensis]MCX9065100.1 hypothetical protein [Citrobacter portucalensis]